MQLLGRRSSVFTRVPLMFAEQLGVTHEFLPIKDMTETHPAVYAGNPALKPPILRDRWRRGVRRKNICRVIAEHCHRRRQRGGRQCGVAGGPARSRRATPRSWSGTAWPRRYSW